MLNPVVTTHIFPFIACNVTRVVNLCSGKPYLPVKMFLPLVPVNIYFTGKKNWSKKCLFALISAAMDGFNLCILELKAIILINSL